MQLALLDFSYLSIVVAEYSAPQCFVKSGTVSDAALGVGTANQDDCGLDIRKQVYLEPAI